MSAAEIRQDWKGYALTALLAVVLASGGTYFAIGRDAVSRGEMADQLAVMNLEIKELSRTVNNIDRRLSRQEGATGAR